MKANNQEIDMEIREIIELLNNIKGITTTSSCSGHGQVPTKIWFTCDTLELFNNFLFNHFNNVNKWQIVMNNADINRFEHKIKAVLTQNTKYDDVANPSFDYLEELLTRESLTRAEHYTSFILANMSEIKFFHNVNLDILYIRIRDNFFQLESKTKTFTDLNRLHIINNFDDVLFDKIYLKILDHKDYKLIEIVKRGNTTLDLYGNIDKSEKHEFLNS